MDNTNLFISKKELIRKEKERKKLSYKGSKEIIINSEWLTYEELDRRTKLALPSLDESKIKIFIIEPFFYKNDEVIKLNYYEREDYLKNS